MTDDPATTNGIDPVTTEPVTTEPVTADPRTDPQPDADERTTLTEFLDWYRLALVLKVSGVTEEQARARHVSSNTTIVGLVRHCAEVERSWFRRRFAGESIERLYGPDAAYQAGEDPDFEDVATASLTDALADYVRECEVSRRIVADAPNLDVLSVVGTPMYGGRTVSLRWILVHMIEETARHVGHADILRELTDGTTGD
jgi:uncharacterized damage-inducible protein DinB